MKTLRIRQFLFAGLLAMVLLPRLFYTITDFVLQPVVAHQTESKRALADQMMREITQHADEWKDPAWQQAFQNRYASSGIPVFITDPSGHKIFQTGHPHPNPWNSRQMTVIENGKVRGVVHLYLNNHQQVFAALSAVFAVIATIFLIGWLMGKYVLKPLSGMSAAAKQIAKGNLDFRLPASRLTEVDEVRAAFEKMGDSLRESLNRQAKLEEERRFFISSIAHDLRTPLFVLRGSLWRMEQGLVRSPEKMERYIHVCRQKAEQLERLISDLFAYAKTEFREPSAAVRGETFDFGDWMEEIMDHYRLVAQTKNIEIYVQRQTEKCLVRGDKHLLERAVLNLMDNAFHYTPSGGEICVQWRKEGNQVVFTVADTGPGIPEQDLPHIFEPFYRAEKSRNPKTGGTGLGLTIAKRILHAHQGDLFAGNQPGKGAVFTGRLPLHGCS
jgi:signal transduction histidine kinase